MKFSILHTFQTISRIFHFYDLDLVDDLDLWLKVTHIFCGSNHPYVSENLSKKISNFDDLDLLSDLQI